MAPPSPFRLLPGGAELVLPLRLEERHEVVLRGPVLALRWQVVRRYQREVIDLEPPIVRSWALSERLPTAEELCRLVDRNPPRRVVGNVKGDVDGALAHEVKRPEVGVERDDPRLVREHLAPRLRLDRWPAGLARRVEREPVALQV